MKESWRGQPKLRMVPVLLFWVPSFTLVGGVLIEVLFYIHQILSMPLDTKYNSPSWPTKASISAKRYGHACQSGFCDGHDGIHVAGGLDDCYNMLTSTEKEIILP